MDALRVEGLSKRFGGVWALREVSLTVGVGERVAIIGPNGAGKTTFMNLLSGQLSPTAGEVRLFGRNIGGMPAHRRAHLGIARSFQVARLFEELTVLDSVLLALQGLRRSRFQMFRSWTSYGDLLDRARQLLGDMELWEKRNEKVKDIAYGEQRRLEIALSVASEPKALLLDEPTNGLTAAEGSEVVGMIHNMGRDITVLVVAHDMDLVFGVAERIVVLHYGELIADGTPMEISKDVRVNEIYMGTGGGGRNAGTA